MTAFEQFWYIANTVLRARQQREMLYGEARDLYHEYGNEQNKMRTLRLVQDWEQYGK